MSDILSFTCFSYTCTQGGTIHIMVISIPQGGGESTYTHALSVCVSVYMFVTHAVYAFAQ